MQAPIGSATTTDLVKAVSGVGALGTLAASWTEPAVLRRQLRALRASVGARFCVNLVLAFDQRERLEVVLDDGVGFVSFSWGLAPELLTRAREAGITVLVQVGEVRAARAAADAGADVIIVQGVEAGGHVQGTRPLLELLGTLRPVLDLPIVAAGGIADRAAAQAAMAAGADGVACGTAFLAALEADVHPEYLDRVLASGSSDTVLTTVFDIGWPHAPHRVIRNDTFVTWDIAGRPTHGGRPREGDVVATRAGIPVVRYSDAQPTRGTSGDIAAMALYAGTSVASVHHRAPADAITREIAPSVFSL